MRTKFQNQINPTFARFGTKIISHQLSLQDNVKGIFRHQAKCVDGEEATQLTEESKLSKLPERHVQSCGQCKSPNLKTIK